MLMCVMLIRITDIVAAVLVLSALVLRFKYRWVWAMYVPACWAYAALNFYSGLPAQGIMDIVAGGIAAWNAATWGQRKDN